jgi:signal transduction histidine kinase
MAYRFLLLLSTTTFKVTLLHLALTLVSTAALWGFVWWVTVGYAVREIRMDLLHDAEVLQRAATAAGGVEAISGLVEARIATDQDGTHYFLLRGSDGQHFAGNLPEGYGQVGWYDTDRLHRRMPEQESSPVMAYGMPLAPDGFLVVGRDLAPIRMLEMRLRHAAVWAGGGALLTGALGGLVLSRSVARRAVAMETALGAVEAGVIGQRLLVHQAGDEFDRLAIRINAVLNRIEGLVATLRGVTDDVAHDLRTPLSRLRQRLESAQRYARNDNEWRASIDGAIQDCDRILSIFAALLRIAEIEGGAQRAGFESVELSEIVESVVEVYQPAAELKGQIVCTRIEPQIRSNGDRNLLTQMLANLFDNAVRYTQLGGCMKVELRGGSRPGEATLSIQDNGPGIPQSKQDRVFRRFQRLDPARNTPGTGLGLSLVKAIADLHGIEIKLSDAAPGLRVTLVMPTII